MDIHILPETNILNLPGLIVLDSNINIQSVTLYALFGNDDSALTRFFYYILIFKAFKHGINKIVFYFNLKRKKKFIFFQTWLLKQMILEKKLKILIIKKLYLFLNTLLFKNKYNFTGLINFYLFKKLLYSQLLLKKSNFFQNLNFEKNFDFFRDTKALNNNTIFLDVVIKKLLTQKITFLFVKFTQYYAKNKFFKKKKFLTKF